MESKTVRGVLMFDAAFPPPIIGGKEKQALLLSKSLIKKGIIVESLSYEHNNRTTETYQGIKITRVKPGLSAVIRLFFELLKKRKDYDILHIHTPSTIGKILSFYGFIFRYKTIFKFPNENMLNSKNILEKLTWNIILNINSSLIVLENDTEKKLLNSGLKKSKINKIPNGVEIGYLKRTKDNKTINLLFVARLSPAKLCDQLILACKTLKEKNIKFRLKVVGDGPSKRDLKKLVDKLDMSSVISFEGYQKDTISYMYNADILILPSEKEGMSNVLLEAISIGLPIIATNVGSAEFLLGKYSKSYLCDPYDPLCLAEKIHMLSLNLKERCEYSNYLYQRGIELFSIEAIALKYIKLYERLLSN